MARVWLYALVAAIVAAAGGFAAGYLAAPRSASAPSAADGTISITAAGTLAPIFPAIASAVANETPGASAPLAAQQYEGSLAALSAIRDLGHAYDVAAVADYRLIPSLLEPDDAAWEIAFASTPEVLAYDPSVPALSGITAENWAEKIAQPGIVLGVANQSTDPNGYNGIFVLELEGLVANGSLSALYDRFYTTPVGGLAEPDPTTTRVEPESQAATLLATHVVSAFIIYRSYAVSEKLSYVPLDPRVGLGATDPADVAFYANATTTILTASGSSLVRGAPVLFAATVPANAPNPALGLAFLHYLDSPTGSGLLAAAGFTAIFPAYTDRTPSSLPGTLAPDVTPLPTGLAALLA